MKKKEIIIISIILVLALSSFIIIKWLNKNADMVVVRNLVSGEILLREPLNKDAYYTLEGDYGKFNIEIINAKVRAINVECPNKICEKTGFISHDTIGIDRIICIPNNLEVYLELSQ